MERLQNTWNIVHENFMVFYNVFVAFVGLNNNTIVAMQNIEFGSVSSDRYPDPAENASIEAIPILPVFAAFRRQKRISNSYSTFLRLWATWRW